MIKKIKKYTKDTAGFSFVELMVVIGLIGILSAISVPNLLKSLPEKRLKGATRNLYADLQKARLLAVKENQNVTVRFDTVNIFYYLDNDQTGEPGNATWEADELKKDLADYGGVEYGCSATSTNWNGDSILSITGDITFNNMGEATNRSIYLQSQNNQEVCYAVTVTRYGAVKIRRFSGSWE
ncbi:MAG: prepilin-type N-terminal cleavage/methylation domain-containing protein [Candidatus Electrothrix sp. AR3]|nr:prepilin-type N-terminal cleavage/methylation domain-containing protein [Candidatus Electrothrix sp. AR3]